MGEKERNIRNLLQPLMHKEENRVDSFLEEDIDAFLDFVVGFHIEDEAISYLRAHPKATTQELWHFISDNAPEMDGEVD